MSQAERRVTVQRTLWPHLQALAKRDGVTVADVANAILLQTVTPYGPSPCPCTSASFVQNSPLDSHNAQTDTQSPDPYQIASVDSW